MQSIEQLHLYEFPERTRERIYCFLKDEFRTEFFRMLMNKYKTKVDISRRFDISEDIVRGWISGKNVRGIKNRIIPIQSNILFRIAADLDYKPEDIEKFIIELKTDSNSHVLKNPILPIKLNYEFGRLIGISLRDGHLTKIENLKEQKLEIMVYSSTQKSWID